jgi:hypothetical protein
MTKEKWEKVNAWLTGTPIQLFCSNPSLNARQSLQCNEAGWEWWIEWYCTKILILSCLELDMWLLFLGEHYVGEWEHWCGECNWSEKCKSSLIPLRPQYLRKGGNAGIMQGQVPEVWQRQLLGPRREGNATVPAAQTLSGATAPPATQHVGETHTVLEIIIAGGRWLSSMMISVHSSTLGLIWAPFTHPDIYFEASTLLEGEWKFILLSVDNEQAVTPKISYFSFLPLVPLPPDTLKHDTEPWVTQSRTACHMLETAWPHC